RARSSFSTGAFAEKIMGCEMFAGSLSRAIAITRSWSFDHFRFAQDREAKREIIDQTAVSSSVSDTRTAPEGAVHSCHPDECSAASHVGDYCVRKLAGLHFLLVVHQAGEVVGHDLLADGLLVGGGDD